MVLAEKGTISQHDTFEAQVYVLKKAEGGRSKPIINKYMQQVFSNIWNMNGCVLLDEQRQPLVMPGDTSTVTMWLRRPMVIRQGQKFSMRENQFTSLTGRVTKILEPHDEQLIGFNAVPRATTSSLTEAQIRKLQRK